MEIIISGHQAVLKKNTSFDFISENRLFTGSDSYTLTITFPLRGCQQNIDIFGHLHRADVEKEKVIFDCDIRDGSFFKTGTITVTEISEAEVKTQFLEGRSEQNFDDTFDGIYVNQLDLGYPTASERSAANVDPNSCYKPYPSVDYMPLPWVNNTSGNMQNELVRQSKSSLKWKDTSGELSFQPYLCYILKKICEAIGYAGDFSVIEASRYAQLLICNTLPAAWDAYNFAIALPHWTLAEFFEELENFLFGEFTVNHKEKTISFAFSGTVIEAAGEVQLSHVVDAYSVEVSQEDESSYVATSNIRYADNDNRYWAYRSCDWYIRYNKKDAVVYDTLSELCAYTKQFSKAGVVTYTMPNGKTSKIYRRGFESSSDGNKLYYAKDVDTYFILFCYDSKLVQSNEVSGETYNFYEYSYRLEPINQFGERFIDDDADELEIRFVPAWLDDTDSDIGQVIFLECGELTDNSGWTVTTNEDGTTSTTGFGGRKFGGQRSQAPRTEETDDTDYNGGALAQSKVGRALEKGEQDEIDDYFDCIYVGFWYESPFGTRGGFSPAPVIDGVSTTDSFSYSVNSQCSLRLNGTGVKGSHGEARVFSHEIDPKKKYSFSFLSKHIPNPRALFYIQGGKYICEKLTATFKESGRSELIKGSFYRVVSNS